MGNAPAAHAPEVAAEEPPPPAREDLPVTGKQISVRVRCSNRPDGEIHVAEYLGMPVTSSWTIGLIQEALEAKAGLHRFCQQLLYKGRQLDESKTIESILASHSIAVDQIPETIKFWAQVDDNKFPECLQALCFDQVPLGHEDFELPASGEGCRKLAAQFSDEGFYWHIPAFVLERYGLSPPAAASGKRATQVHGQASPLSKITLKQAGWEAACIPVAAKYFAWASPVTDWNDVGIEPFCANSWAEDSRKQTAALSNFLTVGGFIYFDDQDQVVGVTTLYEPEPGDDYGGFQFEKPRRWHPEWTTALVEHDRFHDVNIETLEDTGAKLYCWLRPGEKFKSPDGVPLANQPYVPHGGFVYLFHKAPFEATDSELGLDRYFAVAASCGGGGVARSERQSLKSFHLVGFEPEHPAHPSASSDKFELSTPRKSPRSPSKASSSVSAEKPGPRE
eukprot:TRINITY_DN80999_c0_g1_i1.p1 TRINITY_DN80999_c0_g1~~TRINITY_DN80999_c0_g1_i1.p1  ORF type:complete len:482 (+),score=78.06 TRINITY_DN80999_c0_g1_i1:100-1446(+)